MMFKEKVHQHCLERVDAGLEDLQKQLRELSESVANETKSTAGDKYETARAMLHIEQDQIRSRIATLQTQKEVLSTISRNMSNSSQVSPGSLVLMGDVYYYLSIGLGRLQVEGQPVVALSIQSPLGSKLKGLTQGDCIEMNGKNLLISELE